MTPGQDDRPRDGNGRLRRTVEGAERDAEACKMYTAGASYLEISDALGYGGKQNAHRAIKTVLLETIKAPAEELRARAVLRAEEIYVMARDVARTDHPTVSHGKVVCVKDPESGKDVPLIDDMPKLAAMDRMSRAEERLAKLRGLDAPTKFENLSLDAIQAEIARVEAEIASGESAP
jgi:hypothetical protein